jgi:hypothetical protein
LFDRAGAEILGRAEKKRKAASAELMVGMILPGLKFREMPAESIVLRTGGGGSLVKYVDHHSVPRKMKLYFYK